MSTGEPPPDKMVIVTDMPEDILAIIFSFLDAQSFLSFSRTCKDLYQYRQDPVFWRNLTSSMFRLPISPLLKAEGPRWFWLYKRLRTQTRLYTWGQGLKGNLGPGVAPHIRRALRGPMMHPPVRARIHARPVVRYQRTSSNWPTEVHVPDEVGVIADLQCGGFSTSILSSEGKIYTVGLIDSDRGLNIGEPVDEFRQLEYLTQSNSAIRQFSSGRRHILALTDSGEILSWDRVNAKGLKVFSRDSLNFGGRAVRVVAGWGESSAYIPETGIIYWDPIKNDQRDDMLDGFHVKERVIPGTARHEATENSLVEVISHVVLEAWIVWLTSDGKLRACEISTTTPEQTRPTFPPFEVPGYQSTARLLKDVQGQYNKFAVFTDRGEVLAGNTDYLRLCAQKARHNTSIDDDTPPAPEEWPELETLIRSRPSDNPALQHNQVISLAFGDHHYHALHVNGKITSYGTDSQSCGALGLGDMPSGARFRGLRTNGGIRPDAKLLPQAERRGRQIWFEPEKREWLKYMQETLSGGRLPDATDATGNRRRAEELWTSDNQKQLMFSEWVEQEGRHWREGPLNRTEVSAALERTTIHDDDFHLHPYFALAVSASGWHSGALVLVDEDEAHATRQRWLTTVPSQQPLDHDGDGDDQTHSRNMPGHFEPDPAEPEEKYVWEVEGFPRVKLPDGFEMPGHGDALRPWRDSMPSLSDLGLG